MENALLRKKIAEFERENEKLRNEYRIAKKNEYRNTGYFLIIFGAVTIAISYFTYNNSTMASIFLLAGLGTTFMGILYLFLVPERFVRYEVLEKSNLSSIIVLNNIIQELQLYSKGIYILDNNEIKVVLPVRPGHKPSKNIQDRTFHLEEPGNSALLLIPLGYSLMKMIEKRGADWSDLQNTLSEAIIDGLELARSIEVAQEDGIVVKVNDPVYINLCNTVTRDAPGICRIGCSFCSLIACMITRSTGKDIVIENVEHDMNSITVKFSFY